MNPQESKKFNADSLAARLAEADIELPRDALSRLWRYHELLRAADAELNLTRIRSFESMIRKHYVDSLIVLKILAREGLELPAPLVDVGTGAGFPGIPLAIARPDLPVVLVEGRGKRVDFLKSVVAALELDNVSVVGQRLFGGNPGPPGSVITRAVATMADTISRTAGARSKGDRYLFMKGPNCDAEIATVAAAGQHELLCDAHYVLPNSDDRRRLVVWVCNAKAAPQAVPITSKENSLLKTARSLWRGRMIRKHGLALVLGRKLIGEIVRRGTPPVESLLLPFEPNNPAGFGAARSPDSELAAALEPARVRSVLPALLAEVDEIGTGGPALVVRVSDFPAWGADGASADAAATGLTVCLPLGDPENLGAAVRSCVALGVDRIVLTEEAAHPFHPRAIRASAGACFNIPFLRGPRLAELKPPGCSIFTLRQGGADVAEMSFPEHMWLVVGEEGGGIPEQLQATDVGIPISPAIESLNGSVALALALDHIRRGRPGSR